MANTTGINYVFVLMLENHSFDVMLSQSYAINQVGPIAPVGSNQYLGETYLATGPAPLSLTTDPGHELYDTLQQLTNINPFPPNPAPNLTPYPSAQFPADFKNGTGFVENYATSTDEGTGLPQPGNFGDVVSCFSGTQLPVLNQLAKEFCVCTNWFSSIPGPTWPNRFFLHLASSNGMDCSPTTDQIEGWYEYDSNGFVSNNGSIFQALGNAGWNYRIYHDCDPTDDPLSSNYCCSDFSDDPANGGYSTGGGWVPQVGSLNGISSDSWNSVGGSFASDLAGTYNYQYTFIEPHYGDIYSGSYQGGSSQHPMDDVYGGEQLLKFVYETLRASDIWNESLLIVTYDEHGGFYDSVPPPAAVPPGDGTTPGSNLNQFGFQFDQLGVRVPALLISPLIAGGTIDDTQYDHTSVIATLAELFGTATNPLTLTNRDKAANHLLGTVTMAAPRTDCPKTLAAPTPNHNKKNPLSAAEKAKLDLEPLPRTGNLIGTMGTLHKIHRELSSKDPITQFFVRLRFKSVKTLGQLRAYSRHVAKKYHRRKKRK